MPTGIGREYRPSQEKARRVGDIQSPNSPWFRSHSPRLQIQATSSLGGLAMAAIQHLPYPLMVLDNQKTLVMANEALGRLLDIQDYEGVTGEETEICGKAPGQDTESTRYRRASGWQAILGLLGTAFWMLLLERWIMKPESHILLEPSEGDTGSPAKYVSRRPGSRTRTSIRDTVVEVSISPAVIIGVVFGG